MYARIGRVSSLQSVLQEFENRVVNGSAPHRHPHLPLQAERDVDPMPDYENVLTE
jgi:hypothetical protein